MKIDIGDYDIEESPCTLAYVLLIMLSGSYGYSILAVEDLEDEWLVVVDQNDVELFRVAGGGVFGTLLLSVLTRLGQEIGGETDDDDEDDDYNPWNYLS